LPIGEAICGNHWAVLLMRLLEHNQIIPLISMNYAEAIRKLTIYSQVFLSVLPLGDDNYADALVPKIVHGFPHPINAVLV